MTDSLKISTFTQYFHCYYDLS